LIRRKSR